MDQHEEKWHGKTEQAAESLPVYPVKCSSLSFPSNVSWSGDSSDSISDLEGETTTVPSYFMPAGKSNLTKDSWNPATFSSSRFKRGCVGISRGKWDSWRQEVLEEGMEESREKENRIGQ